MKLRYKEHRAGNVVTIDAMESDVEAMNKLSQSVVGPIPSPLPGGVLDVTFYVYKKKPSWLLVREKKVEFTYDIWKRPVAGEKLKKGDAPYILFFKIKLSDTSGLNIPIDVPFDCTTKKNIIKHLLNALAQ